MRINNAFKLALVVVLAGWPPPYNPRALGACTAGESPAPVPLVANGSPYDGYLDVTPCSGTCGGPCYLTTTSVLQWCRVTGSSESPEGCQPVDLPVSGYLGRCNSSPRDPFYRCGCADFEPQPCSLVAATARNCSP